jgi:hypothetical protein
LHPALDSGDAAPPGFHPGMLVGGVVVEDNMNDLADCCLCLDEIEETDELLMPMTLMQRPIV